MPTYLLHGFRWPRPLIRIHIILQNLDDAAAEWLMAPLTGKTLVENFTKLYPSIMPSLPNLRFIEQYDPLDESGDSKSQPFAYVADYVHEVKLGVDVDEMRAKGISNDTWSSMVELRDKLAPGEKLSWFVVVCGDVERWAPPDMGLVEGNLRSAVNGYNGHVTNGPLSAGSVSEDSRRLSTEPASTRPSTSRSLKKVFSLKNLRKSKSMKSLSSRQGSDTSATDPPPPVPPLNLAVSTHHPRVARSPGTAV